MSSWQEPSGRERAIEALMDRDDEGDYYRVRKVMVSDAAGKGQRVGSNA